MDQKPENEAPKTPYSEAEKAEKPKGPKRPLKERWATYQPDKKSMYKAVGYSVFLTVALGFTLGGWYTAGGAQDLMREARIDYAAQVCADKFRAADVTGEKLAELKQVEGRYQRRHALAEGDWVLATRHDSEAFIEEVNMRCGQRLVSGAQPPSAG